MFLWTSDGKRQTANWWQTEVLQLIKPEEHKFSLPFLLLYIHTYVHMFWRPSLDLTMKHSSISVSFCPCPPPDSQTLLLEGVSLVSLSTKWTSPNSPVFTLMLHWNVQLSLLLGIKSMSACWAFGCCGWRWAASCFPVPQPCSGSVQVKQAKCK